MKIQGISKQNGSVSRLSLASFHLVFQLCCHMAPTPKVLSLKRYLGQPTPLFLPGESQSRGSLVGFRLWGCPESDTTEVTQQQQQCCDIQKRSHVPDHSLLPPPVRDILLSSDKLISNTAAAAKSLQLCPTLCDPIDGISPGSPVPGILQARTLEWVAISFSSA